MQQNASLLCPDCERPMWVGGDLKQCNVCGYRCDWRGVQHGRKVVENAQPNPSIEALASTQAKPTRHAKAGRRPSSLNRVIEVFVADNPSLTTEEVMQLLDEHGIKLPKRMRAERGFESAYRNPTFTNNLDSKASKIRKKLRDRKLI